MRVLILSIIGGLSLWLGNCLLDLADWANAKRGYIQRRGGWR